MANDSTLAIDADGVIDLVSGTANASADVDTNFDTVVDAFNASLNTATGHYHDGTDSRSLASGAFGLTLTETMVATIMGVFE